MRTYTSRVGTFRFPEEVQPAIAKQVRDAVVGQVLSPESGTKRPKTSDDCVKWVRENCSDVLKHTDFKVTLA